MIGMGINENSDSGNVGVKIMRAYFPDWFKELLKSTLKIVLLIIGILILLSLFAGLLTTLPDLFG